MASTLLSVALLTITSFLALTSLMLRNRYHLRFIASTVLLLMGAVTSAALSFTVSNGYGFRSEHPDPQDFGSAEPYSTFFLAIGSAMTAKVFWVLPDKADSGLHVTHVQAVEVAAFAIAPPAVCGFIEEKWFLNREAQCQVMFVVIPQVVLLVVPLLLSYLVLLGKLYCSTEPEGSVDD